MGWHVSVEPTEAHVLEPDYVKGRLNDAGVTPCSLTKANITTPILQKAQRVQSPRTITTRDSDVRRNLGGV